MKEIVSDPDLVAYCGLYCGACKAYLQERCPGCRGHDKATWCKIRTCCMANRYLSCAECVKYPDPNDCGKFNNLLAQAFGLIFRSDRLACINQIKRIGLQSHADVMTIDRRPSL